MQTEACTATEKENARRNWSGLAAEEKPTKRERSKSYNRRTLEASINKMYGFLEDLTLPQIINV